MLTQTLLNVAIVVYFSVSSGHGTDFGLHAAKNSATPIEDTIVIREESLAEKLGLESVARPDEELAALRSSACGLKSALGMDEQIKKQMLEKLPNTNQWKDKFVATWDEDGGFYLDRTYHPAAPVIHDKTQIFTFNIGMER